MRFGWSSQQSSQRILGMAGILFLAMLLFYLIIYLYRPFPDLWNDFLSIFFTQLASLLTATFATLVWNRYERTDAPRRIWGWFAAACCGVALLFRHWGSASRRLLPAAA